MSEMVRVNTRISKTCNEWLDKRSEETGVPKSTLIFLALEQYMSQTDAISSIGALFEKLEKIEKQIKN